MIDRKHVIPGLRQPVHPGMTVLFGQRLMTPTEIEKTFRDEAGRALATLGAGDRHPRDVGAELREFGGEGGCAGAARDQRPP